MGDSDGVLFDGRAVFGGRGEVRDRRNPIREDGARVEGRLGQGQDPPSGGLADRIAFAGVRALPLVAVLERENDEGGRFTIRPFGDSHRTLRPSACAAASCGLVACPPVAGRAASSVAGATPSRRGRGCASTLGPVPHQALRAGGRSPGLPRLSGLPPLQVSRRHVLPEPLSCSLVGYPTARCASGNGLAPLRGRLNPFTRSQVRRPPGSGWIVHHRFPRAQAESATWERVLRAGGGEDLLQRPYEAVLGGPEERELLKLRMIQK